ncbi:protein-L-isoaspartate(D-aspartate) O-methyltransferase [Paucibacter sp. PLA-PC-4]|uniref:protein-L-isoaspartate(D-aspartate) O-methyltransferase n=1 Tax=Paucibacter sp. PLA-PC-4 TaxID=2993655 RepID=UPI00224AC5B3|nr:protein-L-isoaspartate(D-aspartate) O-methyltransferase [Paucibacter sp. PLA-PC-4]MCX2865679.1 protein-L-isoaspartate(D-aspartate) O-methyltransferase [Paucibacter sp. PLA-PC-4]
MSATPPETPKKRFPLPLDKLGGRGAAPVRELLMPQRHLQQATADAARRAAPSGLGMDSAGVRLRMVQRLQREGLRDERVLQALAGVPRHEFVDTALAIQAYEDTSLPIGHGQTISKPSVVGRMIELLLARPGASKEAGAPMGRVLEIGTGCGYQAAVLARLARQVTSIERIKPLHDKARASLATLNLGGVRLIYGDGRLGHASSGPYDGIIAAAGGDDLPEAWMAQLAPGGRLVAPMQAPGGRGQVLVVVDHLQETGASRFVRTLHEAVLFVPLKSGVM